MADEKRNVSLTLDADVVAGLDDLTQRTGLSRSALANVLLKAVVSDSSTSVLDLVHAMVGGSMAMRKEKKANRSALESTAG